MKLAKKPQVTQLAIGTNMPRYEVTYSVVIEVDDEDEAEIKANDIECQMTGLNYVKSVSSDPYMEELK